MDESDDDEASDNEYLIGKEDRPLVALALQFLEEAIASKTVSWAERASLAKLLHVFSRVPQASSPTSAEASFTSRRMHFGTEELYFWFTVGVEDQDLAMHFSGRYYNPRSGGDSFMVFRWAANIGVTPSWVNYAAEHKVVTRLVDPFKVLREMSHLQHGVMVGVTDDDNHLLEDATDADSAPTASDGLENDVEGEDDEVPDSEPDEDPHLLLIGPESEAERQLIATLDLDNSCGGGSGAVHGVEDCDGCGVDLSTCGLFVDGRGADSAAWGNYCASCCLRMGVTLGMGNGQLYAKQPDGSWHGVAGFED